MITQPTYPLLPDHTQLPESDGTFVQNFQEHPQSVLLTDSIELRLRQLHPDGQFCIGQDSGIYWRLPEPPEPLVRGATAPDWFYVPDVPPMLDGRIRRSYVLWKEPIPPLIVLEFVSGDGAQERDRTPGEGKFWIYERVIRPVFYGIYEVEKARIEVYELILGRYQLLGPNERAHYPISPLGVELGIWQGRYLETELPWLRWWDGSGNLLLTGHERAERAEQRATQAEQRAILAEQRANALAEQLRRRGTDPEDS